MSFLQALTKKIARPFATTSMPSSNPYPWHMPPNTRAYVIGDIHGCAHLLVQLLEQIQQDAQDYSGTIIEIFLGDYVDRGPDSKRVLEILRKPPQSGNERICLKGNHEEALLRCLADSNFIENWRVFGAVETLLSFGLNPHLMVSDEGRKMLQQQLLDGLNAPSDLHSFLTTLPSFFELGDYYFVHAGIKPDIPLASQTDQDRLWIREEFLAHTKRYEKMVVHGHTPQESVEIKDNRINLDTGAYATNILSCLVLEGNEHRLIQTNS